MQRPKDVPTFLGKYHMMDPVYKRPFEQVSMNKSYQKYEASPVRNSAVTKRAADIQYMSMAENKIPHQCMLPNYEPTKCSSGRNGIIKAYAANTNQGIVRDYNEDRVSIILNIVKPQSRTHEQWPKCSFFGVYDGHGGAACADFLRDNLHQFVIKEKEFPWNPIQAIKSGFKEAEQHFLGMALDSYQRGVPERSGSCAIVSLIVGDICYIANVGDSRSILSGQRGKKIGALSQDHKPETEQERIQRGGGRVYQTHCIGEDGEQITGPARVLPGRLSVSRTFGDIEAKLERFGGNSKVVISDPEIKSFKIQHEHDFIVLGTDGIFDKMSSTEVMSTIWRDLQLSNQTNLHTMIASAVEAVLRESINRKSSDNVTLLLVAFSTSTQEEDAKSKLYSSVERISEHPRQQQQIHKIEQQQNRMTLRRNDENNSMFANQQRPMQSQQLATKRHPMEELQNRIRASYIF